mmetsp:Transcript_48504/g.76639  ORF Transcript_48504/g.76639 Transcript_48504/m.76639 type:complete len:207 (-) Transcript_48504:251-871(-)
MHVFQKQFSATTIQRFRSCYVPSRAYLSIAQLVRMLDSKFPSPYQYKPKPCVSSIASSSRVRNKSGEVYIGSNSNWKHVYAVGRRSSPEPFFCTCKSKSDQPLSGALALDDTNTMNLRRCSSSKFVRACQKFSRYVFSSALFHPTSLTLRRMAAMSTGSSTPCKTCPNCSTDTTWRNIRECPTTAPKPWQSASICSLKRSSKNHST